MQVKKQHLVLDMEQQTGCKLGKEYVKAVLSSYLFIFYAEYIIRNSRLDEAQLRGLGEISKPSDMQMAPPLWQKVKKN